MISMPSLAAACGSGQQSVVEFLIDMDETDLDQLGPDGVSPLCAAASWGYARIVQLLLDATCDVNVHNTDSTKSTALHVATCQEHTEVVDLLLQAGADTMLEDADSRTPCDFASLSDSIWPLFEARGMVRTPKQELVRKRLIRKLAENEELAAARRQDETVKAYTRPGSAYVRSDGQWGARPSSASDLSLPFLSSNRLPSVDELADEASAPTMERLSEVGNCDVDVLMLGHEPGAHFQVGKMMELEDEADESSIVDPSDFPDEVSVASGAGRAAAAFLRAERKLMIGSSMVLDEK